MGKWGLLARLLAPACLTGGLVVGALAPAQAADDYPWAGMGQCPILPQAPIEEPVEEPVAPASPAEDGAAAEPAPEPPPPPPVLDPVSGHLYDPRGPRPTCARNVWSVDGSIGDPWGFVLRNCTSFVAWRLHERNGMAGFTNHARGVHWGDAENWDDVARRLGHRVDGVPAIGAVAQTDDGPVGHVAWVSAIGSGTVTIEEYNHAAPGGYSSRTVPVGEFRYLHLADLAPAPYLGSDRPVVSVPDGLGDSSRARVNERGTLWVSRPGRPMRVAGPRGAFSPMAAPALAIDRAGMPWLAGTTRDGRVLVGLLRDGRLRMREVGVSARTASPALAITRSGRPLLAAVAPDGTLTTRRLTSGGRWSRSARVGRARAFSTQVAPVLGTDGDGMLLLLAVGADGSTSVQSTGRRRLVHLPGAGASVTSTPTLTTAPDGTTYVHQVTASGDLRVWTLAGRRWSRPETVSGGWSPYASPAVAEVAGQLHVAAVDERGALVVRAALPGERSRLTARVASGDPTRSPGLVTRRNDGVFVVTGPGAPRLLTRPASAVVVRTAPTRAGFTP